MKSLRGTAMILTIEDAALVQSIKINTGGPRYSLTPAARASNEKPSIRAL